MFAGWYCCLDAGLAWETKRTKSSLIVASDELVEESSEVEVGNSTERPSRAVGEPVQAPGCCASRSYLFR